MNLGKSLLKIADTVQDADGTYSFKAPAKAPQHYEMAPAPGGNDARELKLVPGAYTGQSAFRQKGPFAGHGGQGESGSPFDGPSMRGIMPTQFVPENKSVNPLKMTARDQVLPQPVRTGPERNR